MRNVYFQIKFAEVMKSANALHSFDKIEWLRNKEKREKYEKMHQIGVTC
jgi:hypothetical protein